MIFETIFLAKVLGLYLLIFGLALIYNRAKIIKLIYLTDWHNSFLPFVIGSTHLFLGLVVVISHPDSLLINFLGWAALFKSLFCLFNSSELVSLLKKYTSSSILIFHGLISIIIGLLLIFIGFF